MPPVATVPPTPLAQIRGRLDGVATIDLVARQDLDRFNLDLRDMAVSALTVDGKPATEVEAPASGEKVDGAAYWHVQDDDARDTATYTFEITVPAGKTAVANGLPDGEPVTADGTTTGPGTRRTSRPAT